MDEPHRPTILFVPEELHLFRAVGAYHAWNLAAEFDLVLLIGENYRGDRFVERFLAQMPAVREVIYFPITGNIWHRHRAMASLISEVVARTRPRAVYQHAFVYAHNLYAFYLAKDVVPNVAHLVFQAAMTVPDLKKLADNLMAGEVMRFASRNGLPMPLAGPAFRFKYRVGRLLHHRILPLVMARHVFPVPYDLQRCEMQRGNCFFPSAYLVYSKSEAENIEREYSPAVNCQIVENPVGGSGMELDRLMHNVALRRDRIVILPSQDWLNEEIADAPAQRTAIIARYAATWIDAIRHLRARYVGYLVAWKLHPAHRSDETFAELIACLKRGIRELEVIDSSVSAELLMLESRVVVSDVSSALWWAALRTELVAVSLDLWGGRGGDAFRGHRSVNYVNALSQIDELPLVDAMTPEQLALPSICDAVRARLVA